ncbi:MAG: cytochrome c-type biogenesis protein CcmH [Gammaproteobacteria bacterium]|nr:cytochrome c-type biogenesis protein CcmH [Gammaproteobacteria bacterium]MDH5388397.1 cytochrome c-type biogenesis protein CcmH [Gammaproteobacteria bacterium]
MKILLALALLAFNFSACAAPMDAFEFDTKAQEKIFNKLNNELRCLVCQNQAIAESNAGLAKDLRAEIHSMLLAGKTEEQIKEFMVDRYGDYVLYDPPFKPMTWLLWIGPMAIFLMGLFYARRFIFQQKSSEAPGELSDEESARLRELQSELKLTDRDDAGKTDNTKKENRS